MNEKIIINKFGSIDYIDIEIKRINLLIGAHSTGKTTSVLILKYFRIIFISVFQELHDRYDRHSKVSSDEFNFDINAYLSEVFRQKVRLDYSEQISIDAEIKYSINSNEFVISFNGKKILFKGEFVSLARHIKKCTKELNLLSKPKGESDTQDISNANSPFSQILSTVSNSYLDYVNKFALNTNPIIYIPAARAIAFFLHKYTKDMDIPPYLFDYYKQFTNSIDYLSNVDEKSLKDEKKDIFTVFQEILSGKIKKTDKEEMVLNQNDKNIDLQFLSSGQQESLPILSILFHNLSLNENKKPLIIIEEPEANLHPEGQIQIVDLISKFSNILDKKYSFMITTHSPFIIETFNNHIQAYDTNTKINKKGQGELEKIISNKSHLKIEEVGAYLLKKEKPSQSIIEDKSLVGQGDIGDESFEMAKTFSNIMNIEQKYKQS